MKNPYTNLIRSCFPEHTLVDDGKIVKQFISTAESAGIFAFDTAIVDQYHADPDFLEKELLQEITSICDIPLAPKYLSRLASDMTAKNYKSEEEAVIFFDELLKFTMFQFLLTIFSLANNGNDDNFRRCFKSFVVTLDLQGRKHLLGTFDPEETKKIILMPTNLVNISAHCYWAAWTFIVGHEIYHLCFPNKEKNQQTELEADRFGYQILIDMIYAQKAGKVKKDLQAYEEYTYLAPNMVLEYLKLRDFYLGLCNEKNSSFSSHPAPEIRQDLIFDLFDSVIPDDMDTEEGNAVYYAFERSTKLLREQLIEKYKIGKLNSIIESKPEE